MLRIQLLTITIFIFVFLCGFGLISNSFAGVSAVEITDDTTLTEDVLDSQFIITSNNVEFDCDGFEIRNDDSLPGPAVEIGEGVRRATVKNCNISEFDTGIDVGEDTLRTTITENTIQDFSEYGIVLRNNSDRSNISNNIISNAESEDGGSELPLISKGSYYNIGIYLEGENNINNILSNHISYTEIGIQLYSAINNKVRENSIFRSSYAGIEINSGEDIISRKNELIANNIIANEYFGIYLDEANQNIIDRNILYNNGAEIYEVESEGLYDCDFESESCDLQPFPFLFICDEEYLDVGEGSLAAIFIYESDSNKLRDNILAQNCGVGFSVLESTNNTINSNEITANLAGVVLYDVNNGAVSGNNIFANLINGIFFEHTSNSIMAFNTVIGNGISGELYDPFFIGGIIQHPDEDEEDASTGNTIRNNTSKTNSFCDLGVDPEDNNLSNNKTLFENESCFELELD